MRDQLLDEVTKILGYFKIEIEIKNIQCFNNQSRILINFDDEEIELRLAKLADNFASYFNDQKVGVSNRVGDVPNFIVRDDQGRFLGTVYAAPDIMLGDPTFAKKVLVLCYGLTEEQCHDVYKQRVDHDYHRVPTSFITQRYP